jgi:hypothetical protein
VPDADEGRGIDACARVWAGLRSTHGTVPEQAQAYHGRAARATLPAETETA